VIITTLRNLEEKKDHDANCNTEIIATIVGEIDDKKLNIRYWKAHIRTLTMSWLPDK